MDSDSAIENVVTQIQKALDAAAGYATLVAGLRYVDTNILESFPDSVLVRAKGYDDDGILVGLMLSVNLATGEIEERDPEA